METEMKKMSIARALKEKERIAKKLAETRDLFASINSVMPDVKRTADAAETYAKLQELQKKYLEIKKAIAAANAGISGQLTEMLVVRAEIEFYTRLNCQEESITDELVHGENGAKCRQRVRVVYNTHIKEDERRKIKEALEQRLDDLQDEVDSYNATHTVEIAA